MNGQFDDIMHRYWNVAPDIKLNENCPIVELLPFLGDWIKKQCAANRVKEDVDVLNPCEKYIASIRDWNNIMKSKRMLSDIYDVFIECRFPFICINVQINEDIYFVMARRQSLRAFRKHFHNNSDSPSYGDAYQDLVADLISSNETGKYFKSYFLEYQEGGFIPCINIPNTGTNISILVGDELKRLETVFLGESI